MTNHNDTTGDLQWIPPHPCGLHCASRPRWPSLGRPNAGHPASQLIDLPLARSDHGGGPRSASPKRPRSVVQRASGAQAPDGHSAVVLVSTKDMG